MKYLYLILLAFISSHAVSCKKDIREIEKPEIKTGTEDQLPQTHKTCLIAYGPVFNTTNQEFKFNYNYNYANTGDTFLTSIRVYKDSLETRIGYVFNYIMEDKPVRIIKTPNNHEHHDVDYNDEDGLIYNSFSQYIDYIDADSMIYQGTESREHFYNTITKQLLTTNIQGDHNNDGDVSTFHIKKKYSYDANGNIIKIETYSLLDDGDEDSIIALNTFSYDNKRNPYYELPLYPLLDFPVIKSPNNIISEKVETFTGTQSNTIIKKYNYTYSEEMLPEKVALTYTSANRTFIKSYTYTYYCK